MATPFLDITGNTLNFEKFKKKPKKNTPISKSFWAFLISTLFYISVFYAFNLSPSTVFCTTKFWFFISNTLILIIAADFGSFSSSKDHDFYEEFMKNRDKTAAFSSYGRQLRVITEVETIQNLDEKRNYVQEPEPVSELRIVEKTMQNLDDDDDKNQVQENPIEKIVAIDEGHCDRSSDENQECTAVIEEVVEVSQKLEGKEREVVKCGRSNSDITRMAAIAGEEAEEEKTAPLQRSMSERYEEGRWEEENEFSRMSDEELNRRVEEFIRRFNRQIRLQAVRSRNNFE